jgi:radical SAM protein with 4Fe4S-binding SPASM domain
MDKKKPFVSIIIVNFNGKKYLDNCFSSLFNLNYPKNKLEIIMVDNGSNDNSIEFVNKNFPKVKIIKNDINNYCRANNLGIERSKGKYIALINHDIKADKNWLIELIKVIESNSNIGVVGSKILFMNGQIQSVGHEEHPYFYWVDKGFGEQDKGQYNQVREVSSICGCSVLYRRKCLEDIGLLDEDFNIYLEDVDMSLRCRKNGWRLLVCPTSIIYHKLHGAIRSESAARFHQEKNRLLLIAKHWPDKLPQAIVGREYFTNKLDYEKEKDICNILAFVYTKLVATHNMEIISRVSPQLFATLRRIFHSERDFFIQSLKAERINLSAIRKELEERKEQISNLHNKLEAKLRRIWITKQQLEKKKIVLTFTNQQLEEKQKLNQQQQESITQLQQDIARRDQRIETLRQDLESAHKELEKEKSTLAFTNQQLEEKQKLNQQQQESITQLQQEKFDEYQQLQQTIQQRDCLLTEYKRQIEQKQAELQGIYESTGFKYLLRPLWNLLWPIKQTFKKFWQKFIGIRLWVRKISHFFLNSAELFLRIKNRLRVSTKDYKWTKAYLSHIHHNTFPPLPKRLTLMLTSRCNMNCQFCDIPQRNYKKKELSKEEAFKIIDSVYKLGIEELEITGGESFLHLDLWEIVEYASSKKIKVNLTTNGLLINEQIDRIKSSSLDTISISIDGKEQTHNKLRSLPGAYQRIVEAIELLKNCTEKKITINFVVTNKNIYELEEVYYNFLNRDIRVYFWPVNNQSDLYLKSKKEKKVYINFIKRIRRERKISSFWYRYYLNSLNYFENKSPNRRCLGLTYEFGIDIEGNILPCCVWGKKDSNLGNIFQDDLEIMWHSKRFHRIRKDIFTQGCPECYNTALCDFSKITGLSFLLNNDDKLNKKLPFQIIKNKSLPSPQLIHMKFTNCCNLKCRMCDIWRRKNGAELSTLQWEKVISDVYSWLGPFRLEIAGGEPLMRYDLEKIIHYCSQKKIYTVLTTNATLIDKQRAKQLIDAELDVLNISLDSLNPSIHNYLRGTSNTFERIMEAISWIKRYRRNSKKPSICISSIIMKQNLNEIIKIVEYVYQGGANLINFQILDNNFHAKYHPRWYENNEFWIKDVEKLEEVISNLVDLKKRGYPINNSFSQLELFKQYFKGPDCFSQKYACLAGCKNFIVNYNGDALLCWNMPKIGNVLEVNPKKIWYSVLAEKRKKQITECTKTCRILNCNYNE